MTYKWDNKKPTAQMLGRWQPFHDGHYTLFKEIIKKFMSDLDVLFHLASELKVESKMTAPGWPTAPLMIIASLSLGI